MRVMTVWPIMLAVMFVTSLAYGDSADSILGTWNTAEKDAKIEIMVSVRTPHRGVEFADGTHAI